MHAPTLTGIIRRRLLVNFRVDPAVIAPMLPAPFAPQLVSGHAIAGICLIRLEEVRPRWVPACAGIVSENAAHRIAVRWTSDEGERRGVYIPRRDTDCMLSAFAGGRLFPGEHHLASFAIDDDGSSIALDMQARDGGAHVAVRGRQTSRWPAGSVFASLAEASAFFEAGSLGYSATARADRFDGMRLVTPVWQVEPLAVDAVRSSFFDALPIGAVEFDSALLMRDVAHEWRAEPALQSDCASCV